MNTLTTSPTSDLPDNSPSHTTPHDNVPTRPRVIDDTPEGAVSAETIEKDNGGPVTDPDPRPGKFKNDLDKGDVRWDTGAYETGQTNTKSKPPRQGVSLDQIAAGDDEQDREADVVGEANAANKKAVVEAAETAAARQAKREGQPEEVESLAEDVQDAEDKTEQAAEFQREHAAASKTDPGSDKGGDK